MTRAWIRLALCGGLVFAGAAGGAAADPPTLDHHVVVFGENGQFGGWPANHGAWNWGDEILVGFSIGVHQDLGPERHHIDRGKPEHHVLGRSRDGGLTWSIERPAEQGMLINEGGMRHGITDPRHREATPKPITEPIDFVHPDFCMTLRFQNVDGGVSRLYYSYDRGKRWRGPFLVPDLGQPGVMARTDYLVNGPRDCHVFVTVSKSNGKEGRVACARTLDGGLTWNLVSLVGPEPRGFSIMPATVRIAPVELLMATRRREGESEPRRRWVDVWHSPNDGVNWHSLGAAVADLGEGNPPALVRLRDGRICLTYGVRKTPWEIQARLSNDNGVTWSEPIILRSGGGGRDLGYPRTLQRPDGKIVTIYYFTPADSPFRQIAATIWAPGQR